MCFATEESIKTREPEGLRKETNKTPMENKERNYEEIRGKIEDIIIHLPDLDAVDMWNDFCSSCNWSDDFIEPMSKLDDALAGYAPLDVLESIDFDEFSKGDGYIKNTPWGYQSTDDPWDWIEVGDMVDYIINDDEDLGNDEIRDLLEELKEEGE